ncbi:MAG: hypothetical protein ACYC0Q_01950 [Eubacteriales bacterium]
MEDCSAFSGEVSLTFLGENIPAIGPRFRDRRVAIKIARRYIEKISKLTGGDREISVQIALQKQSDGRYSLVLQGPRFTVGRLYNLDELLLKRFRKGLKKKLFILTCFVDGAEGLECLVLTEGLGAVFYTPGAIKNWQL